MHTHCVMHACVEHSCVKRTLIFKTMQVIGTACGPAGPDLAGQVFDAGDFFWPTDHARVYIRCALAR